MKLFQRPFLTVLLLTLCLAPLFRPQAAPASGTAWGWGSNATGAIGQANTGAVGASAYPDPAPIPGMTGMISMASGGNFTAMLRRDGTVWTCGANSMGQLGNDDNTGSSVTTPNPAPTQVAGLSGIVKIAAGDQFVLALQSNGRIWAWGSNRQGQLARSTNLGEQAPNPTPALVAGISGVTDIAAGHYHSLALKRDGTVWAWGLNYFGETAQKTGMFIGVPKKVTVLQGVIAIGAGENHSLAVKSDGTVWAWGNNAYTQLGNYINETLLVPNPVPVQVQGISGAVAVTGGSSWSLALKNDGTVWSWGQNGFGQLGRNDFGAPHSDHPTPEPVEGLSEIVDIKTGFYHNLALKNDGTVWAWGLNFEGELGSRTNLGTSAPNVLATEIAGLANVLAISGGDRFSTAIVKQQPVALNFTQQLISNTADIRIKLQASDPQGNVLTYNIVTPPQHGTLTTPSGAFVTYTPGATLTTGDSFTFQVANGPNASNQSNIATCTIVPNHAPGVVSLVPSKLDGSVVGSGGSSVVGEPLKVALKVTDPEGATKIKTLYVTFNKGLGNATGIVLSYDQASNKLYLRSTDGRTLLGGQTAGSDGTVENDYGILDFANSRVVKSGNNIMVYFMVTPKVPFTGLKKLWGSVKDTGNLQAPFELRATWTVNPAPSESLSVPPTARPSSAPTS